MVLENLYNTIAEGFKAIDGIQTVSLMPRRRDKLILPAILIELAELEPGEDPGTGELGLVAHWEARIVTSDKPDEQISWGLSQAVLYWLFDFNWPSINVSRAHIKQAAPDHFSPEFQGHRVWLIEWTNAIRIGDNVWQGGDAITPETFVIHCGEHVEEIPIENVGSAI